MGEDSFSHRLMNVHDYQFLYVEEGSSIGYHVIFEPWRLSFVDPCKAMKPYAPSPLRPDLGRHLGKVCDNCMDTYSHTLGPSDDSLNEMPNSNPTVVDRL